MCGISAMFGRDWSRVQLEAMVKSQGHRGPDADGTYCSPTNLAGLGHNRLSIIDLSAAGQQPMSDGSGRYWITFNGEIYNYLELRKELDSSYAFRTRTDTEVLVAAYLKWGEACLDRLIGMFAFVIWDERERKAFGARDRFGVKPLHYYESPAGGFWAASEIKALHAAGVPRRPNQSTWSTYLVSGMYDHTDDTFWEEIRRIPPGGCFTWSQECGLSARSWYDVAAAALAAGPDSRSEQEVADELVALLEESVRLRFRADVQVGICVSGGLDSSLLLGLVHRIQGAESAVKTFTFFCGDPDYDELPWVEQMLAETKHPSCFCRLRAEEVPELAARVQAIQDEPFGGLPTLGMGKVHERAVAENVTVLLDGNGLDEGWAGYEYYRRATGVDAAQAPVQGSRDPSTRPECLGPEFAALARPLVPARPFADALLDLQYRDLRHAKIPRAMRFADRVSMMLSRELREPFLDHRIIELGLRQPAERKLRNGQGKYLLRQIASKILPRGVREAPKRAVQTPQREWLRGPLQAWANDCIEAALDGPAGDWFDADRVRREWAGYCSGASDNSSYVWQWLSLGLLTAENGKFQTKVESGKLKAETKGRELKVETRNL
jgi:asparagine synthase (glutamine-hydrolysing)